MSVSVQDLADHLRIPATDPKAMELDQVLAATIEVVTATVGVVETDTVRVRPTWSGALLLPAVGVAVVTVTDPTGGDVPVGDCDVDTSAGVVRPPRPVARGEWVVAVTRVPSAAVDEATLIIARHLWETRRGRDGRAGAFAQPEDPIVPVGFAVPRRAQQLLRVVEAPGFA